MVSIPGGPWTPGGPGRPGLDRPGGPGGPISVADNSVSWSDKMQQLIFQINI